MHFHPTIYGPIRVGLSSSPKWLPPCWTSVSRLSWKPWNYSDIAELRASLYSKCIIKDLDRTGQNSFICVLNLWYMVVCSLKEYALIWNYFCVHICHCGSQASGLSVASQAISQAGRIVYVSMNQTWAHHGFYCFEKGPGRHVMCIEEGLFKQYELVDRTGNSCKDSEGELCRDAFAGKLRWCRN